FGRPPSAGVNVNATVLLIRLPCSWRAALLVERRSLSVVTPRLVTAPLPLARETFLPWLSAVTFAFREPGPDTSLLNDAPRFRNTRLIVIVPLRPCGPCGPWGPTGPWPPTGPGWPTGPGSPVTPLSPAGP